MRTLALLSALAAANAFSPSLAPSFLRGSTSLSLRKSGVTSASGGLPLRFSPRVADKVETRMLGNLFGGGGGGGDSGGEIVSKVYFDVEIGGKPAGECDICCLIAFLCVGGRGLCGIFSGLGGWEIRFWICRKISCDLLGGLHVVFVRIMGSSEVFVSCLNERSSHTRVMVTCR